MSQPLISVVIPAHGELTYLDRTLTSLCAQTMNVPFEVVLSLDRVGRSQAEESSNLSSLDLAIVECEGEGPAAARNAGIERARGRLLVFLDSDVEAAPDLLETYWREFGREPSRSVFLGRIDQAEVGEDDWVARRHLEGWRQRYSALAEGRVPVWRDLYSGNFAIEAAAFAELSPFEPSLPAGEDVELGFRLAAGGYRLRYLDRARVVHLDRKNGRQILASYVASGRGMAAMALEHPRLLEMTARDYHQVATLEKTIRRIALRTLGVPALRLLREGLMPGLTAALPSVLAVVSVLWLVPDRHVLVEVLAAGTLGGLVFVVCYLAVPWSSAERALLETAVAALKSRRRAG